MRVEFSRASQADIDRIGDYIAKDSPLNALKFTEQLFDRCEEIANAPEGYVSRPEVGENIRSVAFKDYLIFYSFHASYIRIERIFHGSQNIQSDDFG